MQFASITKKGTKDSIPGLCHPWFFDNEERPYGTILGKTTLATRLIGMILPSYYPSSEELTEYSTEHYANDGFNKDIDDLRSLYGVNISRLTGSFNADDHLQKLSIQPDPSKRNLHSKYRSVYECEDRYCAMGIKSVASAVLSCIGLYTVVQQPVNMGLQRAVRSIMGGGKDKNNVEGGLGLLTSSLYGQFDMTQLPQVSSEAFECYYYITRLGEFYKYLFDKYKLKQLSCEDKLETAGTAGTAGTIGHAIHSGDTGGGEGYVFRIPDDLEGEFGKVLFIINQSKGSYTDQQCMIIVTEVNQAYNKYKDINDTVLAFVKDVNRRFSILTDEEATKELKLFEDRMIRTGAGDTMDTISSFAHGSTGSMPFMDESYGDSDNTNLDAIVTPSDALASSFSKYSSTNLDALEMDTYKYEKDGDVSYSTTQQRALEKYRLGCDFKLYQKLAMLRTELDRLFDEYLKNKPGNSKAIGRTFPLSTEVYNETFHGDFVKDMKERLKGTKGSNEIKFKVVTDLINSKGKGTAVDKSNLNTDSLMAFNETVALMSDGLVNARSLLKIILQDITLLSGELFVYNHFSDDGGYKNIHDNDNYNDTPYVQDYDNDNLKFDGLIAQLLSTSYLWKINNEMIEALKDKVEVNGAVIDSDPNDTCKEEYKISGKVYTDSVVYKCLGMGTISDVIGDAKLEAFNNTKFKLSDCVIEESDEKDKQYDKIKKLAKEMMFYNIFTYLLIVHYHGIKYFGMGSAGNNIGVAKNVFGIIAGCKKEYRPFQIALSKYPPPHKDEDKKRQFLAEAVNQTLMRFDLSYLQTTVMGTVTRLSSSLGGLVTTTISTQGTYMDVTPLQNVLIDSLGELKKYSTLFYDNMPKGFMQSYYTPADTTKPSIVVGGERNTSIYQLQYDISTIFEPHVSNSVKYSPLIADANTVMSNTHKSLVGNLVKVVCDEKWIIEKGTRDFSKIIGMAGGSNTYSHLSTNNSGASAILSAIMPSHYEPVKLKTSLTDKKDLLIMKLFDQGGIIENFKADVEKIDLEKNLFLADLSNGNNLEALLPALNYGIKSMIESFYDYGSRKIYKGILDSILGTRLSKNIEEIETSYPDLIVNHGGTTGGAIRGGGSSSVTKLLNGYDFNKNVPNKYKNFVEKTIGTAPVGTDFEYEDSKYKKIFNQQLVFNAPLAAASNLKTLFEGNRKYLLHGLTEERTIQLSVYSLFGMNGFIDNLWEWPLKKNPATISESIDLAARVIAPAKSVFQDIVIVTPVFTNEDNLASVIMGLESINRTNDKIGNITLDGDYTKLLRNSRGVTWDSLINYDDASITKLYENNLDLLHNIGKELYQTVNKVPELPKDAEEIKLLGKYAGISQYITNKKSKDQLESCRNGSLSAYSTNLDILADKIIEYFTTVPNTNPSAFSTDLSAENFTNSNADWIALTTGAGAGKKFYDYVSTAAATADIDIPLYALLTICKVKKTPLEIYMSAFDKAIKDGASAIGGFKAAGNRLKSLYVDPGGAAIPNFATIANLCEALIFASGGADTVEPNLLNLISIGAVATIDAVKYFSAMKQFEPGGDDNFASDGANATDPKLWNKMYPDDVSGVGSKQMLLAIGYALKHNTAGLGNFKKWIKYCLVCSNLDITAIMPNAATAELLNFNKPAGVGTTALEAQVIANPAAKWIIDAYKNKPGMDYFNESYRNIFYWPSSLDDTFYKYTVAEIGDNDDVEKAWDNFYGLSFTGNIKGIPLVDSKILGAAISVVDLTKDVDPFGLTTVYNTWEAAASVADNEAINDIERYYRYFLDFKKSVLTALHNTSKDKKIEFINTVFNNGAAWEDGSATMRVIFEYLAAGGEIKTPIDDPNIRSNISRFTESVNNILIVMYYLGLQNMAGRKLLSNARGGDLSLYEALLVGEPTNDTIEYFLIGAAGTDMPESLTDYQYIQYPIPNKDSLLTTSLALTLRKIYTASPTSRSITASPVFLYETLADVKNEGLLDVYKLKLPMFREYFLKLANKCRVIRAFMTKGCGSRDNKRRLMGLVCPWLRQLVSVNDIPVSYSINEGEVNKASEELSLPENFTISDKISIIMTLFPKNKRNTIDKMINPQEMAPLNPAYGTKGILGDSVFYNSIFKEEERYAYLIEIVTNIEDTCTTIAGSCDNMLNDFVINDKFMSLGSEFVENHKRQYDCPTYTPLSLVSVFSTPASKYVPLHSLGTTRASDEFKLQYGAKDILFSDTFKFLNEKYIGGAVDVIKNLNSSSRVRIDISNYYSFIKRYLSLFRFNYSVLDFSEQSVTPGNYRSIEFKGGSGNENTVKLYLQQITDYYRRNIPNQMKWIPDGYKYNEAIGSLYTNRALSRIDDSTTIRKVNYDASSNKFTIQKVNSERSNPYGIWLIEYINELSGNSSNKNGAPKISDEDWNNFKGYCYNLSIPDLERKGKVVLVLDVFIVQCFVIFGTWKYMAKEENGLSRKSGYDRLIRYMSGVLREMFEEGNKPMIWGQRGIIKDAAPATDMNSLFKNIKDKKVTEVENHFKDVFLKRCIISKYKRWKPNVVAQGTAAIYKTDADNYFYATILNLIGKPPPVSTTGNAVIENYMDLDPAANPEGDNENSYKVNSATNVAEAQVTATKNLININEPNIYKYLNKMFRRGLGMPDLLRKMAINNIEDWGAYYTPPAISANDSIALGIGADCSVLISEGASTNQGDVIVLNYKGSTKYAIGGEIGAGTPVVEVIDMDFITKTGFDKPTAFLAFLKPNSLDNIIDSRYPTKYELSKKNINMDRLDDAAFYAKLAGSMTVGESDDAFTGMGYTTETTGKKITAENIIAGTANAFFWNDNALLPNEQRAIKQWIGWGNKMGILGDTQPGMRKSNAGTLKYLTEGFPFEGGATSTTINDIDSILYSFELTGICDSGTVQTGKEYKEVIYNIIKNIYKNISSNLQKVLMWHKGTNDKLNKEIQRLVTALLDPSGNYATILSSYNIASLPEDFKDISTNFKGEYATPENRSLVTGGALVKGNKYSLVRKLQESDLIYTALSNPLDLGSIIRIINGDELDDIKSLIIEHLRTKMVNNKISDDNCNIFDSSGITTSPESLNTLIGLLIELNVNPINVHSLQRFMPFSNIYNYSYTLDRFIYTMYNLQKPWDQLVYAGYSNKGACRAPGQQIIAFQNVFTSMTDPSLEIKGIKGETPTDFADISISESAYTEIVKEVFIRMMMDPYAKVDQYAYGLPAGYGSDAYAYIWGPIGRIMKGFDQLGMGIPKFLSDQLYNKALLNSMSTIHLGPSPSADAYGLSYGSDFMSHGGRYRDDSNEIEGGRPDMTPYYGDQTPRTDIQTLVEKVKNTGSTLIPESYGKNPIHREGQNYSATITRMLGLYNVEYKAQVRYDLYRVFNHQPTTLLNKPTMLDPTKDPDMNKKLAVSADTSSVVGQINQFRCEGYERFNTQLVRNVFFITNLQRMMRYAINVWLTKAYGAVSRDHRAIAAEVTERRFGDSTQTERDIDYTMPSWI